MRKRLSRKAALTIALTSGLCCTPAVHAVVAIPVIDAINEISNLIIKAELLAIHGALTTDGEGTVNYYTHNIDNSITKNTTIDADLTWIISYGKDEIVPIPREVAVKLQDVLGEKTSDAYAAQFQAAEYYDKPHEDGDYMLTSMEGSRTRKAANDALVKSIEMNQLALKEEAARVKGLSDLTRSTDGHGRQLQIANALAGAEVDQLMRLRSMMLVSEASRAAEALAVADRDARAIATSKAMREGLSEAYFRTIATQPKF